jgi:Yip1 domain
MDEVLVAGARAPEGLSQAERVVDTFVAPSKTFADILRSTSWWLPFLLLVIFVAASAFAIDKKIGFERVTEQQISQNPKSEERMSQLTPEQRATQMTVATVITKDLTYGGGIFFLIIVAIAALLNWASMNFGFGAKTTFGQNFAVVMYASLPMIFIYLLNIILVYTGVNTENFDLKNPVGTNLGYYMTGAAPWIRTALSFFDLFRLWSLALTVIGTAIISRKTKGQAAIVVVGWWIVSVLLIAGITAATS